MYFCGIAYVCFHHCGVLCVGCLMCCPQARAWPGQDSLCTWVWCYWWWSSLWRLLLSPSALTRFSAQFHIRHELANFILRVSLTLQFPLFCVVCICGKHIVYGCLLGLLLVYTQYKVLYIVYDSMFVSLLRLLKIMKIYKVRNTKIHDKCGVSKSLLIEKQRRSPRKWYRMIDWVVM